jgi:hypothetical protein
MKPHVKRPLARRLARGQALVEYSFINWILLVALVVGMTTPMFGKMNVIDLFLRAYQIYYDSIYFMLNLPFP